MKQFLQPHVADSAAAAATLSFLWPLHVQFPSPVATLLFPLRHRERTKKGHLREVEEEDIFHDKWTSDREKKREREGAYCMPS